jgi:hypothetical protein
LRAAAASCSVVFGLSSAKRGLVRRRQRAGRRQRENRMRELRWDAGG